MLRDRIGHAFADPALLAQALTHRSAAPVHNERLEFLGDGVVNLIAAEALFQRWPKADEGAMTRARAELVREASLATIARTLQLGERLTMGPGEMKSGGHRRDSILADALEAVIGAVYLDGGHAAADALVRRLFDGIQFTPALSAASKDAKTALQEWLQGRKMHLPQYRVVGTAGAAHNQTFDVECQIVELGLIEHGKGGSRRAAEQAAAGALFAKLKAKHA